MFQLDAALEGELETVKKTVAELADSSKSNDDGITALHNAICAGWLVESELGQFLLNKHGHAKNVWGQGKVKVETP